MTGENLLTYWDYYFLAWIVLGIPVASYRAHAAFKKRRAGGDKGARRRAYNHSLFLLIGTTLVLLTMWFLLKRRLAELGLSFQPNAIGLAIAGLVFLIILFLVWQVGQSSRDEKFRRALQDHLARSPGVAEFLPQSLTEYRRFKVLAISAGITEEIIFRGYLIFVFSFWLNPWLAGAAALVPFVLSHLYQEKLSELIKVALVGALLSAFYLLSGSLLASIVLHAALDLGSGAACWRVHNKSTRANAVNF